MNLHLHFVYCLHVACLCIPKISFAGGGGTVIASEEGRARPAENTEKHWMVRVITMSM